MIHVKATHPGAWIEGRGYLKRVLFRPDQLPRGGFQLQATKIQPGDRVPAHRHLRHTEVMYVLSGTSTFRVNGQTIVVSHNDALIIEAGDTHEIQNGESGVFIVVTFKIDYHPEGADREWF
jgi:quercetin dioxygenase-like cupin family protein